VRWPKPMPKKPTNKTKEQKTSSTPPDQLPAPKEAWALSATSFPIVGIGASAGGLAAFEAFFSAMPDKTVPGMAFVLVQHLSPDHGSMLTDLVQRYTAMKVVEVEDGMTVHPNCAYIIPPNRDMALLNGALQLLDPSSPRGLRLPIDFFFRSLAQDQHERAICIVLSGTGSDGTQGARAVKGEGGMVMVQNPESTEYDGMPRSAIAAGLADFVLPPAEMPAQLMAYTAHAFGTLSRPAIVAVEKTESSLRKIFTLLRVQTQHDFSHYKENTISRRIQRRMAVHQIERIDEYVRYLQATPAEVEALFRDLLIGVTSFFRDPEAFETLRSQCIPRLFSGRPAGAAIRVWVPGCSTGEEAYSIAILLQEHMEQLRWRFKLQVFATDIDSRAIEQARKGHYPSSIAGDVTPGRLARFFIHEPDESGFSVQKGLRDMLVFSEQDLIKDPPFSKLDLISCRNLLIYMDGELQKRLIPLFHYSLNPGGFLFLGTSESVGDSVDSFAIVDRKAKIYQRKEAVRGTGGPVVGRLIPTAEPTHAVPRPGRKAQAGKLPLKELTERTLLQHLGAVALLVSEHGDILYLHGRTGLYLEPAPGEAGLNIFRMAREGLRRDLTVALQKAVAHREPVRYSNLRVKTNGHYITANLMVRPVTSESATPLDTGLFLVVLQEVAEAPAEKMPVAATGEGGADMDERIAGLEQELRAKEEYLQSTTEELETSNEELQSANEEMQSVNEELQSTNEELETSKEELQSVNEELSTVNAELQTKVADLSQANNDMNNLLAGTGMGTVFVDHQQCIKRFTPAVTQLIHLIQTDVGRPIGHIVSDLEGYDRLVEDIRAVLDTLIPKDIEVQTKSGAWYLLGIRPYRTLENVIEGAVITFVEITALKVAQAQISAAARHLSALVRDSSDAIVAQDMDGGILAWNPAAEKMYGWSETEALRMNIRETMPEAQRMEALTRVRKLARHEAILPFRMQRLTKDGRVMEALVTATALTNEAGQAYAIATTEREWKQEESLTEDNADERR